MNGDPVRYTVMKSPHGSILIARTRAGLTLINFQRGKNLLEPGSDWVSDADALRPATDQLHAYFSGERTEFDLPLAPVGTKFQRNVWTALQSIPCGTTTTYAAIARTIGMPTAVRAVANANGRNPLPIVIPCHRVIGSDGKLRGYAFGLDIKAALLDHEWKLARAG